MTRERVKELLPIMEAYSKGKQIQYYDAALETWFDIPYPSFIKDIKYRVVPEPKYRPFENRDECYRTMLDHTPFGWVIDKLSSDRFNINSIDVTGVGDYTYKQAFEELNFADGTPFGAEEKW